MLTKPLLSTRNPQIAVSLFISCLMVYGIGISSSSALDVPQEQNDVALSKASFMLPLPLKVPLKEVKLPCPHAAVCEGELIYCSTHGSNCVIYACNHKVQHTDNKGVFHHFKLQDIAALQGTLQEHMQALLATRVEKTALKGSLLSFDCRKALKKVVLQCPGCEQATLAYCSIKNSRMRVCYRCPNTFAHSSSKTLNRYFTFDAIHKIKDPLQQGLQALLATRVEKTALKGSLLSFDCRKALKKVVLQCPGCEQATLAYCSIKNSRMRVCYRCPNTFAHSSSSPICRSFTFEEVAEMKGSLQQGLQALLATKKGKKPLLSLELLNALKKAVLQCPDCEQATLACSSIVNTCMRVHYRCPNTAAHSSSKSLATRIFTFKDIKAIKGPLQQGLQALLDTREEKRKSIQASIPAWLFSEDLLNTLKKVVLQCPSCEQATLACYSIGNRNRQIAYRCPNTFAHSSSKPIYRTFIFKDIKAVKESLQHGLQALLDTREEKNKKKREQKQDFIVGETYYFMESQDKETSLVEKSEEEGIKHEIKVEDPPVKEEITQEEQLSLELPDPSSCLIKRGHPFAYAQGACDLSASVYAPPLKRAIKLPEAFLYLDLPTLEKKDDKPLKIPCFST